MSTPSLTPHSARIGGILLISLVGVAYGGTYLLQLVTGSPGQTDVQLAFARAGHAHAGVLLILGLVCLLLADAVGSRGPWGLVARLGVPVAAILMPLGFFTSVAGAGTTEPNALVALVWIGGLCLAAGVLTLGVQLLRAGWTATPGVDTPRPGAAASGQSRSTTETT
ncbi:hypothetical protein RIF23_12060 [Lipingzhangella sp. LS1_29]|uniref:Integral membrane protein n=1 Tax=Lipingzhangella rawalii TaxID=2055835 RepID=A0ABU2H6V2_9ACTN|nr:hypothetical protein [Lipingzhangella rawalii]MDS1271033.1 hypothetical protein [Lipingzhangella rawalii]